jgi:D-alanyl-lipoteichoic acid acyltransferase DltB (MBOAT superfamily)
MLFNSLSFIFVFLPIALAGYYVVGQWNHRAAAVWLALCSVIFYSWTDLHLSILLSASIAFNFITGWAVLKTEERERWQQALLVAGVTGNLLLLFYFKYLFPLLGWCDSIGMHFFHASASVALPLGISFFTFTQIGYLIDCKAGIVKQSNPIDYILFVTFFPHLIAGPILHHREMMPQFANPDTYRLRLDRLTAGGMLFVMGLTKKLCIADQIYPAVGRVFVPGIELSPSGAWIGVLAYSMQLYFDFSGYSDMAIGLAQMFGVRFPLNFNSPYRAACIIDFWQRWHMTLTRYLTLYLYNPVTVWITRRRMAQGKPISGSGARDFAGFTTMVMFPLFFTMGLAGVWHGAGPQFLIFGLLHGIYLTINHAWRAYGPKENPNRPAFLKKVTVVGEVALTYIAVLIAQVFFRASSPGEAMHILSAMAGFHQAATIPTASLTGLPPEQHFMPLRLAVLFGIVWFLPNSAQILNRFQPTLSKLRLDSLIQFEWKPNIGWAVATAVMASVDILLVTGATEFLYFRF